MFIQTNVSNFQANNAGDIILNVCASLPALSRYRQKYEESALQGKPLYLPTVISEATTVKNTITQMQLDISILSLALSLPLVEPLTPGKINQLSKCAMSALYCAVLTSISLSVLNMGTSSQQKSSSSSLQQASSNQNSKDSEESIDNCARNIVDKALEIYTTIGGIFKHSTRSHIYQNHLCMGSWLLISGIQGAMGVTGGSIGAKLQQISDEAKGKLLLEIIEKCNFVT